MRIFTGELKKIFASKLSVIALIAVVLINGFILFLNDSITTDYSPTEYKTFYSDIASMTLEEILIEAEEKIEILSLAEMVQNNPSFVENNMDYIKLTYGDKSEEYIKTIQTDKILNYSNSIKVEQALYNDVLEHIKSVSGYTEYLDNIQKQADTMGSISIFKKNTNKFGKKNIIKTADDFKRLYNVADNVALTPSKGIEMASSSSFTDVISLLFILVLCYQLMIKEKQDGSLFLIKSNVRGRLPFIAAKIFAILCGSVCSSILLYSGNILISKIKYGLGDTSCAIQSVPEYVGCGFEMTIGKFLFYYVIFKIIVFAFFAIFILLISYISKRSSIIYLSLAIFDGLSAVLYLIIPSNHMLNFFKYINIYYFQQSQLILCKYQNVNVFGYPIRNTTCFMVLIALIFVFIVANILVFCKFRTSQSGKAVFEINHTKCKITTNIQRHEFYKLAVTNMAVPILVLFIIVQIFLTVTHNEPLYFDDINYRSYVNQVGGNVTEENQNKIDAIYKHFEDITREMSLLKEQLNSDKITAMEYTAKSMPLINELNKREALESVEERYHQLLNMHNTTGKQCSLIFEKEYDLLTNNENRDIVNALKLLMVLITCFSSYFAMENSSGMERIIKTCADGKSIVARKKIVSSIIATIIACIITYLPDVILTWKNYGLKTLTAPLCSLKQFNKIDLSMPIWAYLLIVFLLRMIGAIVAMLIIHYISDKTKRPLVSVVISTTVLVLPLLIKLWGINIFDTVSLIPLLSGNMLLIKSSAMMISFCVVYVAIAVFFMFDLISHRKSIKLFIN